MKPPDKKGAATPRRMAAENKTTTPAASPTPPKKASLPKRRKNSRTKGKVGEREFAELLRQHSFEARRGQQFCGGSNSPDVVCPRLAWLHFEVKRGEHLNLKSAVAQAITDAGGKVWLLAHRRNQSPWLITMSAETLFQFFDGTLPPGEAKQTIPNT